MSKATRRAVAWVKDDPFGVEFAELEIGRDHLWAQGVVVGGGPLPYRLDYELDTTGDFITSRIHAVSRGEGWRRELDLRRDAAGVWSVAASGQGQLALEPAGGDARCLVETLDCDLELSPITNMMPILRHGLTKGGGPIELTMAWIAVPALSVRADRQRYRHGLSAADHHVIRYEAVDGTFAADITVDADGVVIDYPGVARRLSAPKAPA